MNRADSTNASSKAPPGSFSTGTGDDGQSGYEPASDAASKTTGETGDEPEERKASISKKNDIQCLSTSGRLIRVTPIILGP